MQALGHSDQPGLTTPKSATISQSHRDPTKASLEHLESKIGCLDLDTSHLFYAIKIPVSFAWEKVEKQSYSPGAGFNDAHSASIWEPYSGIYRDTALNLWTRIADLHSNLLRPTVPSPADRRSSKMLVKSLILPGLALPVAALAAAIRSTNTSGDAVWGKEFPECTNINERKSWYDRTTTHIRSALSD